VFVICRLDYRTAQVTKGRSTGKERTQIKKWCKLAKGVKAKKKKKMKSVTQTGLEQGLGAPEL
jgi:hypothetical protein